jgi:hypothetical protein
MEKIRGLRQAGVGSQDRTCRLHVVRDGKDFVVADDPKSR